MALHTKKNFLNVNFLFFYIINVILGSYPKESGVHLKTTEDISQTSNDSAYTHRNPMCSLSVFLCEDNS